MVSFLHVFHTILPMNFMKEMQYLATFNELNTAASHQLAFYLYVSSYIKYKYFSTCIYLEKNVYACFCLYLTHAL